jgi:hypothetical protein
MSYIIRVENGDWRRSPSRLLLQSSFWICTLGRFTRLTKAFSKKLENHIAAVSLHFMFYNFVRIHQTLRITPAMAAGIAEGVWDISDIVGLLNEWEKRVETERNERTYNPFGSGIRAIIPARTPP